MGLEPDFFFGAPHFQKNSNVEGRTCKNRMIDMEFQWIQARFGFRWETKIGQIADV